MMLHMVPLRPTSQRLRLTILSALVIASATLAAIAAPRSRVAWGVSVLSALAVWLLFVSRARREPASREGGAPEAGGPAGEHRAEDSPAPDVPGSGTSAPVDDSEADCVPSPAPEPPAPLRTAPRRGGPAAAVQLAVQARLGYRDRWRH